MAKLAVDIRNVAKRYEQHVAVRDLSLQVPVGSVYGLLGPNGAGKTTTIRMILDIIAPDSGTITVLDQPHRTPGILSRIGYLPEERGLYKKMQVKRVLLFLAELKGVSGKEATRRIDEWLERMSLATPEKNWGDAKIDELSRGMQQKVQFIATLVHDPDLVILDEPFSGLDPVNTEVVRDLMLDLKRQNKTVIFSTHVMEQAEQICDHVVLINKGHILLDGPVSKVRSSGGQTVQLDYEGNGAFLKTLTGVTRVNDSGQHCEFVLASGTDADDLLKQIVGRVKVRRFDTREASLHEIFVRAVGGDTIKQGAPNA